MKTITSGQEKNKIIQMKEKERTLLYRPKQLGERNLERAWTVSMEFECICEKRD